MSLTLLLCHADRRDKDSDAWQSSSCWVSTSHAQPQAPAASPCPLPTRPPAPHRCKMMGAQRCMGRWRWMGCDVPPPGLSLLCLGRAKAGEICITPYPRGVRAFGGMHAAHYPPRAHRHWEGRKAQLIYRHHDHAALRTTRAETSDPKVVNRRLDPRILYTARCGTRGGRAAYPFCATAGIWAWLNYAGADQTDFFWVFRFAGWYFISS
jgi:hypothetical protein